MKNYLQSSRALTESLYLKKRHSISFVFRFLFCLMLFSQLVKAQYVTADIQPDNSGKVTGIGINLNCSSFCTGYANGQATIFFSPAPEHSLVSVVGYRITNSQGNQSPINTTNGNLGTQDWYYGGALTANFTPAASEIDVRGNDLIIPSGDVTPTVNDNTHFGVQLASTGSHARLFRIYNTGTGALGLSGNPRVAITGANAADFQVTTQPNSDIVVGNSSINFSITFAPSGLGNRTAVVTIINSDTNEGTYTFNIAGTGVNALPDVNVVGNGQNITHTDSSPDTENNTDFGSRSIGSGAVAKTFTIENTGTGSLDLSTGVAISFGGDAAADFSVVAQPTSPIAPNGNTTFQVAFAPSAVGTRNATLYVNSFAPTEHPYRFSIRGTGTAGCTQVATTTQNMTWNGSVSSDWTNPCNWTPNGVPTQTNPVVISNAVPVVIPSGTNAAAKSISLNGGFGNKASLTISQGSELRMGSTESTATKFNMVQYATVTNNGLLIFEQSGGGGVNSTFEMGFDDNIFHNYGAVVINSTNSTPIQIGNNGSNGPSATFNNYACATFVNYAGQMLLNSIGASIFNNAGLFRTSGNLAIVGPFTNQSGGVVFVGGTLPNNPITSSGGSVRVNNNPTNTTVFTYTGTYTGTVNGIFTNEAATTSAGTYTQATNLFNPSVGLPTGSQTLYAKITPSGGACNYVVPFTYQNGCSQVATSTETMTWTGSVSTDWANPCNWSPNGVPSATNAVTIPAATNDPIILSGSMVAKHLQITGSGASLTVNNGASLTVSSTEGALTLVNNGLLTNRGTINATNSNPNFVSTYALGLGSNTTFDNYGTVNLTSSQNTGLEVGNGSTVHNYTGGLISIAARGGIRGEGPFINDSGATISISGTNSAIQYNGSVSNSGLIEATGQIEANSGAQINNNACGTIKITTDYFNGLLATTINNGFILIGGTLHSPSGGTFTNNAVLKYGALNVSSILTNSGNASIVVNNTPTPIFTYGGTYNGTGSSTVNGIFTNSTATASAGTFTAPITFVPDVSLPAGLQTLYAKITPSGGACFYVVPFTYNNTFPEMNVKGNGVSINDNDSSPRTADNTDFGAQLVASGTVVRTFTIENTGSGTLNLSGSPLVSIGGTNAGDFTVTQLPTTPVAATNGTTTFQITFDPSAVGLRTASVSIANNDADEDPYNFSIQGTGAAPADYTVTTTGNNVVITDVTGTGETLDISESGSNIRFNVTGKTYSIDGGAVTAFTTPADVALTGKTSITVNAGVGNDIINVGAFTANLPSLTINGGTGDDQVRMNGDITFAANANLDLDLQNDDATPGTDQVSFTNNAHLMLSGTGAAVVKVSRNIAFSNGTASLETVNGNLTLEANQQATASTGNFVGISMFGATVRVNGTGTLTVKGKSGNDSAINQYGVLVQNGGLISGGTSATATIQGSVGAASANANIGVYVTGTNARITSLGGNVSVVGLGGSTGATSTCMGVSVTTNASITAGGSGTVTVSGTGGAGTGNFNAGVYVAGSANTFITSSGGNVSVTGVGGGTGSGAHNYGIWMELGGQITAGGSGSVTVQGTGGTTLGNNNYGILIDDANTQITSGGGNVSVTGQGGGSGGSTHSFGVFVQNAAKITASGTGSVSVSGTGGNTTGGNNHGVYVTTNSAQITSSGGTVSVSGQGGGTSAGDTNIGVFVLASGSISSGGTGVVTVNGTGAGTSGNSNYGVYVFNANSSIGSTNANINITAQGGGAGTSVANQGLAIVDGAQVIAGGSGNVTIQANGGAGTGGGSNVGLYMQNIGTLVSSSGGNVTINAVGGGTGTGTNNYGVNMITNAQISAGGNGTVSVTGQGGGGSGSGNIGVRMLNTGTQITSSGGNITVTGIEGNGSSGIGISQTLSAAITTATNGGNITLIANSMDLGGTVSTQLLGNTTLRQYTNNVPINLGTSSNTIGGPLGLSDAELDQVTTGTLLFGNSNSGNLTVSADITRPAGTNVQLVSGGDVLMSGGEFNTGGGTLLLDPGTSPKAVKPTFNGTDVTATTLSFAGDLQIALNGATPGDGTGSTYTQLKVAGGVNLTGVALLFDGTYVPVAGNTFTLIDNDGSDAVTGTFAGLAEGATLANFRGSGLNATISYVGGSGNNDVVIAINNTNPTITAGATVTRQQSNAGSMATIATVSDSETPAGNLTVTVTTLPANITVTNITNVAGTVTATVAANCFAEIGNNTVVLTVTDANGGTATANFTVDVTANTPPTLTYNNAFFSPGAGGTILPATGPVDNGATQVFLQSVSPSPSPAIITVNNLTGAVSVPNTIPSGIYTITVVASDVCTTATVVPITLSVQPADYTITTTGGNVVITDVTGTGETLAVSESSGNIRFNVAGKTYSIDGAAAQSFNVTPADVPLSGKTGITINTANGNDIINVGAFMSILPSLTINGGTGDDQVFMNGDITFAVNANLDLDLQNDDATPGTDAVTFASGANLVLSGTGTATVKVSRNATFNTGSTLITVNGNLTVEANQQAIPTAGNFIGVLITGTNTQLQTSINGTLTVKGKGGDDASGSQQGVKLAAGGKILGGEGANAVTVVGTGGASGGSSNYGVWLTDANSRIFSLGGPVNVTGTGGGSGTSGGNVGVRVTSSGEITSAGGNVTVVGQGGLNATGNSNSGISVQASGKITSNDTGGNVTITGTGGGSGASALNAGIFLADGELSAGGSGTVDITGQGGAGTGISNNGLALEGLVTSKGGNITLTGKLGGGSLGTYGIYMSKQMSAPVSSILTNVHGGNISIITNSFYIVNAPDIRTTAAGSVTIKPFTAGKEISIFGGFDGVTDPLMLSDLELDIITTGTLIIGDATSGDITSSIGITRPSVTNIQLVSGGDIVISGGNINTNGGTLLLDPGTSPKAVKPAFNGTDVTASTLSFAGDLSIAINGATAGDGTGSTYSQLKIVGAVNLTGVNLVFSGSYTPTGSETFTIVDNDGSDAITGTFTGLAQGATISNFLGSGLNATISYTGGDGNDVVISVAVVNPDYTITTTSNNLIITDISGNGETLDISQNSTNIRFNVTGRKFSLNGGIATNFPADVTLAGKTSITVNTAVGNDIINVGGFSSNLPSLTINGGTGDDAVNFNGNLTLAANANLDLDLQNDDATPGTDAVLIASNAVVTLSGTGTATVKASKNLTVNTGGSLITQNGNLTVEANQQTTPTTGDFVGVDVNGGTLKVTGSGLTLVKGKGGTTNSDRYGIVVQNGGLIEAGNNSLTVQGTGGGGIVSNNYGVLVTDPNSKITSSGGNVSVTGQGGGNGNAFNNYGVYLASSGLISARGTGTVTVQGTGGNGSQGYNTGIYLAASSVTSTNGNISLTGQAGAGGESESGRNEGILLDFASRISAGGTGSIYMEGTGSGSADGFNYGINIEDSNSQIITNNGNIQLVGVGGNGTGTATGDSGINVDGPITAGGTGTIHLQGTGASKPFSHGVIIESPVTTNDGNITLIGVGGADATAQFGSYGVEIVGTVTAGNGKSIIVQGTAGSSTGLFNAGVFIGWADALSSTTGGTIQVTGIEGGSGTGILMESEGAISTLTNGGNITLITNSLDMSGTSAISTNTASSVTVRPYTNGVGVELGASSNTLGGPLSLTDAELDRITAGTINVGNTNSGVITVSAAISRAVNTTFNLTSGGTVNLNASSLNTNGGILNINAVGGISPTAAGIDASAGTVAFTAGNDLNIVINGTTADTDYRQLNVAGSVNLTGLDLVLSTINAFIPLGGATFTIVNNDGSDAIIGTFNGLAEGATLANFLGSGLSATISYTGGTGNDVVITVVCPAFAAPTASVTAQPDCTTPTGTIVVTAPTGGNIQYSVGGTYQSSGTFSGLAPSTYSVTAKNTASGCISEALSLVVNTVPGAPTLTDVTLTQPTCGVPTGTAVVNATGSGTLEYSKDGMDWQLSNTFSMLSPANYTFSVRLQSNPTCVTTSTSQTINTVPGAPTLTGVTLTQPTCALPTGTAVVNATGSGTLEYSKDGMNWQLSNTFSMLSPANYTFSVRLQSNPTCVATSTSQTINTVPGAPTLTGVTLTQPTCALPTGTAVVNATGSGTLEYSKDGMNWQLSNTFSMLSPANYTFSVRLQSNPTCVATSTSQTINTVPGAPTL
ncbi:choice-of-anchor D domain-containing protein, partial [Runella salmonicolor]